MSLTMLESTFSEMKLMEREIFIEKHVDPEFVGVVRNLFLRAPKLPATVNPDNARRNTLG